MSHMFLGRMLDTETMMYRFSDNSGVAIPYEMKIEVDAICDTGGPMQGFRALALIHAWKNRLIKQEQKT